MKQQEEPGLVRDIHQDPMIAGILSRVPEKVAASFSEEQLLSLKAALGAQRGHRHPFDVRSTFGVRRWRWYYIFLAGRDHRTTRRREGRCNRLAMLMFWVLLLVMGLALGLALLAALRWWLGIDPLARGAELVPGLEGLLVLVGGSLAAARGSGPVGDHGAPQDAATRGPLLQDEPCDQLPWRCR